MNIDGRNKTKPSQTSGGAEDKQVHHLYRLYQQQTGTAFDSKLETYLKQKIQDYVDQDQEVPRSPQLIDRPLAKHPPEPELGPPTYLTQTTDRTMHSRSSKSPVRSQARINVYEQSASPDTRKSLERKNKVIREERASKISQGLKLLRKPSKQELKVTPKTSRNNSPSIYDKHVLGTRLGAKSKSPSPMSYTRYNSVKTTETKEISKLTDRSDISKPVSSRGNSPGIYKYSSKTGEILANWINKQSPGKVTPLRNKQSDDMDERRSNASSDNKSRGLSLNRSDNMDKLLDSNLQTRRTAGTVAVKLSIGVLMRLDSIFWMVTTSNKVLRL